MTTKEPCAEHREIQMNRRTETGIEPIRVCPNCFSVEEVLR